MKRLWVALGAFAVLMVLTWITIDDQKFRLAALAVLAMFAVRTWSHSRKLQNEDEKDRRE
jgi:membrane protein implicated in regulation of membrane protease activity